MTELAVLHVPRWTVLLPFEDKLFAGTMLKTFLFTSTPLSHCVSVTAMLERRHD